MTTYTDEQMLQRLGDIAAYSVVLLQRGPGYGADGADAVIWEHGRRNMELQADGVMAIVGPMADDGDLRGLVILPGSAEHAREVMDADPAVQVGIFTYEVHPFRSFPGSALP